MKIKFEWPGIRAAALCAVALAGCDSVKDVRTEPYTPLPKQREVLKGVIHGLGGGRAVSITYDGVNAISLVGPDPSHATDAPESVPFSFGSLEEGTAYNVRVSEGGQPFGKECVPVSGNSGTLAKGQETNVVLQCTPDIPRRDLTVIIPPTPSVFSGLRGAKVRLYTGEWMQERTVSPGQTSVTFEDSLFSATVTITNPDGSTSTVAAGTPLTYTVSASFVDDEGNESRCRVTNATGSNPAANVSNVIIGESAVTTVSACQFTMSGSVAYNAPVGGADEAGVIPGGLLLEVRDQQGNVRHQHEITEYGAFTVGGTAPVLFSSNVGSTFDVAVARQPVGRTCVVGDGGAVSFYRDGSNNPTSVTAIAAVGAAAGTRAWGTRLNVFCRTLPTQEGTLSGTYRLSSSTWKAAPTTANPDPQPITVPFRNYDWTVQNLASSNMMTFFADGTFLYGTHGYISGSLPDFVTVAAPWSTQVEHGFYNYDPVARTLHFTLITDTNPTGAYPSSYSATDNVVWNAARTGTHGLSSAPAPIVTATPVAGAGIGVWNAVMTGVQKGNVVFGGGRDPTQALGRITGRFGGATPEAARLDWELTEPQSMPREMTGTWVSRDNRRFWVWDYLNYYGTHVAVAGGAPSMNDACFTVASVEAPHGIYTRRGTSTGCYAYNRPARGGAYLFGVAESVDFHLTDSTLSTNTFVGVASLSTATGGSVASSRLSPQFGTAALAVLPGYASRIPGGQSAADGRSPSPVVYKIAPAATFAAEVATTTIGEIGEPASRYFDNLAAVGSFTDWCQTEVLGIRASLNGAPINFPMYFCRNRAN